MNNQFNDHSKLQIIQTNIKSQHRVDGGKLKLKSIISFQTPHGEM